MTTIETLLAVPDDIADTIERWRDANRLTMHPGDSPDEHEAEQAAWRAIGAAITANVAEHVAEALRIERGGCMDCPAAKGEAHKMDCRAVRVKR